MNKILIITFLILCNIYLLSAQSSSGEDWNELIYNFVIQADNPVIKNFAAVSQQQNDNELKIYQEQFSFTNNTIIVSQAGLQNKGVISQTGSGLDTRLEQLNTYNQANIWSVGENIYINVKQEGEVNQINSYIENYGDQKRTAEYIQKGNNNNINVALRGDNFQGAGDQWIKINQYGNDHQAEAIIEPFSTPIEILQKPGDGGAGMSISISNSAFNFPMK